MLCFKQQFTYLSETKIKSAVMKRVIVTALLVLLALGRVFPQDIKDRAEYNLNQNRALWYNSGNAAGLAREQMLLWRDVNFGYNIETGRFTDSWGARTVSGFNLGGDMLMDIEGFKVAAKVALNRTRLFKCNYNTSLFEVTWDMPFFVAMDASERFSWRHNEADMEISAAAPLMFGDQLSLGLALRAQGRSALKKADPQSRYGSFDMEMAPGATFAIDEKNLVGMTLRYRFCPATATLTSASGSPVEVALLKGLGAFSTLQVGGPTGIEPLKYRSTRFGLDLQYNRLDEDMQWLAGLSFDTGATRILEAEHTLGMVDKFVIGLDAQGLLGQEGNHKLNFDVKYDRNLWLEGTGELTGRCGIIDLHADYTIYTGIQEDSYDFELGAGLDAKSLSASRVARPEGRFTSFTFMPYVFLGKNTPISKESTLLVKVKVGNNYASKPVYDFDVDSMVKRMYENEAEYLGRFFYRSAADAEYSFRMNNLLSTYARLSIGHMMPLTIKGGRFYATLAVGVMF